MRDDAAMAHWAPGFFTGFVLANTMGVALAAASHGFGTQARLHLLAVVVGTLWGAVATSTGEAPAQGSPPPEPDALADARERIRDLATMESRLERWCDEHGLRHGTDGFIAAQRAKTHVQHAVRLMQECACRVEERHEKREVGA